MQDDLWLQQFLQDFSLVKLENLLNYQMMNHFAQLLKFYSLQYHALDLINKHLIWYIHLFISCIFIEENTYHLSNKYLLKYNFHHFNKKRWCYIFNSFLRRHQMNCLIMSSKSYPLLSYELNLKLN